MDIFGLVLGLGAVAAGVAIGIFQVPDGKRRRASIALVVVIGAVSCVGQFIQFRAGRESGRQLEAVLAATTGGDSYAYVVPQSHDPDLSFVIVNSGQQPLTGVAVNIRGFNSDPSDSPATQIHVGTIPAGGFLQLLPSFKPALGPDGTASYQLMITATNGTVIQALHFRPGRYQLPWAHKYYVARHPRRDNGDGSYTTTPVVLKDVEWSDDLGDGKPVSPAHLGP